MNEQEIFDKKLKALGFEKIPKGITIVGEKKQELLDFINNNSRGGDEINKSGTLKLTESDMTLLDEVLEKISSEDKNIIITLEDLSSIEKDSPVVAYINENEDSKIIAIDTNYFEENNGTTYKVQENPALVDYFVKKVLKSNKPKIVPLGREEANGTAIMNTQVYAGPGFSNYASIGSIDKNEQVVVLGGDSNGWIHIKYWITGTDQEKMGYVRPGVIATLVSIEEEDYYGEFCYAKVATQIRSTQNFNQSVPGFGSVSQYEGMTLLYSYDYFGSRISFVEYSTSNGTKRGYVYESELERPLANRSCVIRATAKKTTYSGPDSSVYSDIGAIGVDEFAAILAKEGSWLYIEYNTIYGRKRGYITDDSILYYHRPSLFPDFYRTTNVNQKDENAWVTNREDVYGGPNTTYATIGAVNNESIINYKTNSSSNAPLTNIEYWVTGTNTRKSGYIATNNVVTKNPGQQPAEKTLTTITASYNKFNERKVYGKTQNGRDMYYYRAGSGQKHMFLIFAHHGWEDGTKSNGKYFAGDGDALIRIGKNFIERFEKEDTSIINKILSEWSIFVFPGINLDGIVDGVGVGYGQTALGDNGSFGRCLKNGLDPNRNWGGNFVANNTDPRNKTSNVYFDAIELKNLRDCLINNRGTERNVLLDVHGWFNQTVGNGELGKYYQKHMGISASNSNTNYGQGYLIAWAKNSPDMEATSTNYPGLGAESCLLELIPTVDYSQNVIENDYGLKFYSSTMMILKGEDA